MNKGAKKKQLHRSGVCLLLRAFLVLFLVATAVFLLLRLVPGDPAVMVLGEHAGPEAVTALRQQLGLDLPLWQQYADFLKNVFLHGDTGVSIKYGVSCRSLILQHAGVSLELAALSMILSVIVSVMLALAAATHKDGALDHFVRILPSFTQGMPAFWLGIVLIMIFAVRLQWLPAGGMEEGSLGTLRSMILPVMTISFGQIPPLVRSLREELLEVLESDFVVTLKAVRIPKRRILFRHVLRNAFLPTLMLLSVNLSYLIGGTLVIEQVFSLDGIGRLLFTAISNRDFPLVQGIALYCGIFVVLISVIVDLLALHLDPRIGKGGRR